MVSAAIRDSLAKLNPRVQFRNPVTLGVYVRSIFTTIMGVAMAFGATDGARHSFLPPRLVTPMFRRNSRSSSPEYATKPGFSG
jgi:high-affinity K+ transport system ATPase subunit B